MPSSAEEREIESRRGKEARVSETQRGKEAADNQRRERDWGQ
jgi:hypothetical protein